MADTIPTLDSGFVAKDKRVYNIVELVNAILKNPSFWNDESKSLAKQKEIDHPEFSGMFDLLELAASGESTISYIHITFSPNVTIQGAIEQITTMVDPKRLEKLMMGSTIDGPLTGETKQSLDSFISSSDHKEV